MIRYDNLYSISKPQLSVLFQVFIDLNLQETNFKMNYSLELESIDTASRYCIYMKHLRSTVLLDGLVLATTSIRDLPREIREPLLQATSRNLRIFCPTTGVLFYFPGYNQTGLSPEPEELQILRLYCADPTIEFPMLFRDDHNRLYLPLFELPPLADLSELRTLSFLPLDPQKKIWQ